MSTMMTSEDGVVLGKDGVEAERRRKVGTHAQWRGAQRGAPSRCRHSQLSPPLFERGSPGAELSRLALSARHVYEVITCDVAGSHIHMRDADR